MIRLIAALVFLTGLCGLSNAAPQLPDEIIVKYRSSDRLADHGKVVRRLGKHGDVVKLDDADQPESENSRAHRLWQRVDQIRLDGNVLYAEPNFLGHFDETLLAVPNDADYSSQWWLPAVGDREMWALGRGADVIVAVIDSGVDLTHPDLMLNLLPNGYNFGDGNAIPQDLLGHGTRVAGIIAARQNNGLGVSGLAPEAKILPIKINVGAQNTFSSDRLASAIAYAVSQGAKIVNLSQTVSQETETVRHAIQAALDAGVVVVAAAGNVAIGKNGGAVEFPGNMPGVLGVAATDQSSQLASWSNSGPEILVAAPGASILSTDLDGKYAAANGTSYAAPIVAATIADMLSINPALSAEVVSRQLRVTAAAIGAGKYTFGNLDAGATGNSLVPHLQLNKQHFSAVDSIAVNFSLPPTGTAVDVYIAVGTPLGSFSLLPGGNWVPVSQNGYQPIAAGYRNEASLSGSLFGSAAPFPPINLDGFPKGSYTWAIALLARSTGLPIGSVMTSTMQLR